MNQEQALTFAADALHRGLEVTETEEDEDGAWRVRIRQNDLVLCIWDERQIPYVTGEAIWVPVYQLTYANEITVRLGACIDGQWWIPIKYLIVDSYTTRNVYTTYYDVLLAALAGTQHTLTQHVQLVNQDLHKLTVLQQELEREIANELAQQARDEVSVC